MISTCRSTPEGSLPLYNLSATVGGWRYIAIHEGGMTAKRIAAKNLEMLPKKLKFELNTEPQRPIRKSLPAKQIQSLRSRASSHCWI